jgi:hypothetical protein
MSLANTYKEFLDKEGYRATITEVGNVQFKKEGWLYLILPDDNDAAFFRILLPGFMTLDSSTDRARVYFAAHEVGSSIKVAKIVVDGDRVHSGFESLVPDFDAVPRIFERSINICLAGAEKFKNVLEAGTGGGS